MAVQVRAAEHGGALGRAHRHRDRPGPGSPLCGRRAGAVRRPLGHRLSGLHSGRHERAGAWERALERSLARVPTGQRFRVKEHALEAVFEVLGRPEVGAPNEVLVDLPRTAPSPLSGSAPSLPGSSPPFIRLRYVGVHTSTTRSASSICLSAQNDQPLSGPDFGTYWSIHDSMPLPRSPSARARTLAMCCGLSGSCA